MRATTRLACLLLALFASHLCAQDAAANERLRALRAGQWDYVDREIAKGWRPNAKAVEQAIWWQEDARREGSRTPFDPAQYEKIFRKLLGFIEEAAARQALLNVAVEKGDAIAAQALLEAGADANAKGQFGPPLKTAARVGDPAVAAVLLDHGAKLDAVYEDDNCRNALFEAVIHHQSRVVALLLDRGADPKVVDAVGLTAPKISLEHQDAATLKVLAEHGVDLGAGASGPEKALVAAAGSGDLATLTALAEASPAPDFQGDAGRRALSAAVHARQVAAVRFLLEHGAAPVALGDAVDTGCPPVVRLLLGAHADPNAVDAPAGDAPLLHAARLGDPEIVALLLRAGAEPKGADAAAKAAGNTQAARLIASRLAGRPMDPEPRHDPADQFGQTELIRAAQAGDLTNVDDILAAGANVNQRGYLGRTALIFAAEEGRLEVVQRLLARGADPNVRSEWHKTAFTSALEKGHADIARLLLASGVDATDAFARNWEGLHLAAAGGMEDLVRMLLDGGAPIDGTAGDGGDTALMRAAGAGRLPIVRLLVERGASLVAQSKDRIEGRDFGGKPFEGSPLMWAAVGGHLEVVKYLLERGADRTAVNASGQTAAQCAAAAGHAEVAQLLDAGWKK